jgi:hypothetical protein
VTVQSLMRPLIPKSPRQPLITIGASSSPPSFAVAPSIAASLSSLSAAPSSSTTASPSPAVISSSAVASLSAVYRALRRPPSSLCRRLLPFAVCRHPDRLIPHYDASCFVCIHTPHPLISCRSSPGLRFPSGGTSSTLGRSQKLQQGSKKGTPENSTMGNSFFIVASTVGDHRGFSCV